MTTPPPDTKVQSETLEEIAHRLVEQVYATQVPTRFALYSDILKALRNERERCAKAAFVYLVKNGLTTLAHNVALTIRAANTEVSICDQYGDGSETRS